VSEPTNGEVLVVDDELPVAQFLAALLRQNGYSVHLASNGHEGLLRFQENRGKISLVVSDVIMPGINGLEMVERIRAIDSEVSILFMSGFSDLEIEEAIEQRFRMIRKPFRAAELLDAVRDLKR
jgi:two-component system cell cycle sensor histidine kinase/response regulator CckA